jgi:hypothetical protein
MQTLPHDRKSKEHYTKIKIKNQSISWLDGEIIKKTMHFGQKIDSTTHFLWMNKKKT